MEKIDRYAIENYVKRVINESKEKANYHRKVKWDYKLIDHDFLFAISCDHEWLQDKILKRLSNNLKKNCDVTLHLVAFRTTTPDKLTEIIAKLTDNSKYYLVSMEDGLFIDLQALKIGIKPTKPLCEWNLFNRIFNVHRKPSEELGLD